MKYLFLLVISPAAFAMFDFSEEVTSYRMPSSRAPVERVLLESCFKEVREDFRVLKKTFETFSKKLHKLTLKAVLDSEFSSHLAYQDVLVFATSVDAVKHKGESCFYTTSDDKGLNSNRKFYYNAVLPTLKKMKKLLKEQVRTIKKYEPIPHQA